MEYLLWCHLCHDIFKQLTLSLFKQLSRQFQMDSSLSTLLFSLTTFYFRAFGNTWLDSPGCGVGLWLGAVITVFNRELIQPFQVELVNIGGTDIVDGNHKLTLGLLWSIILHWQVRGCCETSSFPGIVYIVLLRFSQTFPGFWWRKILLLFWAGK